jgi:hypothetical protein
MLGTVGSGVLELVKGTCDVAGYGEVDSAFVIVLLERDTTVERAGPITCELVFGTDGVEKMISVLLADVLDTEIVDDESERNWPAVILPKAWCSWNWTVAVGC